MRRRVIRIDEELCDGCGICAEACHEGAIEIIDGKARLVSDSYCDGLGDCIGPCPQDAITIVEREAEEYDPEAVKARMQAQSGRPGGGCPGAAARSLDDSGPQSAPAAGGASQLSSWPVQISLVPPGAPFLRGADILLAADCAPFALPDFHQRFLKGRVALVGCPKLDEAGAHLRKLAAIFAEARPSSVTVLRMEVPCCGGLARMAQMALEEAAPQVPLVVHTVGLRGGVSRKRLQ